MSIRTKLLFTAFVASVLFLDAQVTGIKNIPGDYPDLAAAFAALDAQGVGAGGATLSINANQTCPVNGFQLGSAALNPTLTATNPLVINGNGNAIEGFAGTRAGSLTSGNNDGMLVMKGVNYVTFNNIVFNDLPTNNNATLAMENAIAFYNFGTTAGSADGCQYNTVVGCTFNLSDFATAGGAIYSAPYVFGSTTASTWTGNSADIHRGLVVNNNTFATIYNGVVFRGATATQARSLVVTNNTFSNIGGSTVTSYGVYTLYMDSLICNGNTASTAITQTTTNYIVFASTTSGGYQEASNNNITVQSGVTTSTSYGIYLTSVGANRAVNGNTVNFGSFPSITSGTVYGLYCTYSGGNTCTHQMNNNTSSNQVLPRTSGAVYVFYNNASAGTAPVYRKIQMNDNVVSNIVKDSSGLLYPIYAGTCDSVEMSNNIVENIARTNNAATATSNIYGVYSTGAAEYALIRNNTVNNFLISGNSTSTTSLLYGIFASLSANSNGIIHNNLVHDIGIGNGTMTGTVAGIYITGTAASTTASCYNNNLYNISARQALGKAWPLYLNALLRIDAYNNLISDFSTPDQDNTSTSVDNLAGIYMIGTIGTANVSYNTIKSNGLTSSGVNSGASGIFLASTVSANLRNNIVNISGVASGTKYIAALKRGTPGTAGTRPANLNPSYNIYNAPYIIGEGVDLASATNVYYVSGGTTGTADPGFNTSCSIYKTFMLDLGSFYENNLASLGSGQYAPTGASYAESGANTTTTPLVFTDYTGMARGATPDIGALEFAGVGTDLVPPAITYTSLSNSVCTSSRTFQANITDVTGVDATPGMAPRVYFKKSTENDAFDVAQNNSTFNGWKYVEATGTAPTFSFTIDYSLLNSPLATGDVIQYFVIAQDIVATPNVGTRLVSFPATYCPTGVVIPSSGATPTSGYASYTILALPSSVNAVSNPASLCISGNVTLSLTGDPVLGAELQWEISPAGANTWIPIVGANAATYNYVGLNSSSDFRCVISCGGTPLSASPSGIANVLVGNPQVTGTTPAARCGTGSVTLSATASAGASLNWYDSATGGLPIATGNSFTTPVISTTTDYFVAAFDPGTASSYNSSHGLPTVTTTTVNTGLLFNAFQDFTLNTIDVYSNNAGNVTLELRNSAGTVIAGPTTRPVVAGNLSTPQTLTLGWAVPAGTGHRILVTSQTGALGYHTGTFPINIGPGVAVVTNGATATGTTTLNYFIYNMNISVVCMTPRTMVTASITSSPIAATITPDNTLCNGAVMPISVTSSLPAFDTYTWTSSVAGVLYSDAAGTIPYVSGANSPNVYLKSTTAGNITVTLDAFNTTTSCGDARSMVVTVLPAAFTISGINETCLNGTPSLSLSPSTGLGIATYQWQDSPDGVSYNNIGSATGLTFTGSNMTATSYYKALVTDGLSNTCASQPTFTYTVNNPSIASTTPGSRCGTGSVTLGATANAGASLNWYDVPTGGTSIGTGASFSTPSISTNTTYYVSAVTGGGTSSLGPNSPSIGTISASNIAIATQRMYFDVLVNTTLISVDIFPTAAVGSNGTIEIRNSSATTVASVPFTTTVTGGNRQTIMMNVVLAPGTGYQIGQGTAMNLNRNTTGAVYPYTSSGIVLTGNSFNTAYYYYYYNWQVSTGCEGPRSSVLASVNPAPNVAITPSATSVGCNNASVTLTASGADTYLWSTGATTASITESPTTNTTYTVVGTGIGCTATADVAISTDFTAPNVTIIAPITTANCTTPDLVLTASGASSYLWSNGATSAAITVSPTTATSYTVTGVGATGCSATASQAVNVDLASPSASINPSSSTVDCNMASATLTADGGGSYMWGNGATTAAISVNPTSNTTYQVVVTGANGCTATASASITADFALPTIMLNVSDDTLGCNESSVMISANGAASYLWSTGATTASITEMPSTTTTFTVVGTGSNGCTASDATQVVKINNQPSISFTVTNVLCNGQTNGGITSNVTGATAPISYTWGNGATTTNLTGLAAGSFDLIVEDAFGCTATASAQVTQPAVLGLGGLPTISQVTCNGLCDGGVSNVVIIGGTTPYTYAWSNGATTADLTGLCAGLYTGTVTDANGCTYSPPIPLQINEPGAITVTLAGTNPTGFGLSNGSVANTATGGTAPYTFTWSNGTTTEDLAGVAAGTYCVTVVDANGCSNSACVTLTEPAQLAVTGTVVPTSGPGVSDGSITTNVTGGVGPYTYNWSNGATTPDLTGLPTGNYSVTVTDANGNTAVFGISVIVSVEQVPSFSSVKAYPNPASTQMNVEVALPTANELTMELYGMDGRLLATYVSQVSEQHIWTLDVSDLASGNYIVRCISNGASQHVKVQVAK